MVVDFLLPARWRDGGQLGCAGAPYDVPYHV
jgi:hypothetical protein